ncbi:hypothetical protein DFH09DRAFT_1378468 [Mycena vulgaris]|nr:hypothetical protein DFH09DRAFT_1378468 [Mycena vulgaris]
MPRLSLGNLPPEITLDVLNHLDGKTLIQSCSSLVKVCRLWKETIDNSTGLRYTIELWADGMVVGDSGNSPSVKKLEALYERRRAWLKLNWTSITVIPIDLASSVCDLVDGVIAQQNIELGSFTTVSLPSARDPTVKTTSSPGDPGMEPRDFVIDPTQDLVAFVSENTNNNCLDVEYRTLSLLKPHPLAAVPVMSFPLDEFLLDLSVELADDVFSLFFCHSGRIVLLNWREGIIIADVAETHTAYSTSLSLLSPHAFLLANLIGSGQIEIWGFEGRESNTPTLSAVLKLPEMIEDQTILDLIPHSSPFRAAPAAGKLFSKSNESRLCVLLLEYSEDMYSLFIPHRYLRAQLSRRGEVVPWDDWGPQHSRMLPGTDQEGFRYVHGERVVLPQTPAAPNLIQIVDFGMSASRPGVNPESDSQVCREPSTISDGSVFKNAVTTCLPYRLITRPVPNAHIAFMIGEDQLIGVDELESEMTVYAF